MSDPQPLPDTPPREEWITYVIHDGTEIVLNAGPLAGLADRRRRDYTDLGATCAEVYRRVVTASPWERVT